MAERSSRALLERIREQAYALPPEAVAEALERMKVTKVLAGASGRPTYSRNLTDDQRMQQRERAREYAKTPDAQARAKAYRDRPEVKEKTKARAAEKRERERQLLAKAKQLGLDVDGIAAGTVKI